jgi:hypothetical protein
VNASVADAGVRDFDQHLAFARWCDVDLDDLQRLARFKGDGGARFHKGSWGCELKSIVIARLDQDADRVKWLGWSGYVLVRVGECIKKNSK